ncbi:MAG: 50S ribosomal protein L13 [Phycisphaerae bacterium]|nr:50S ribosomal protein L13 [Phycisphaerae bacterium]
MPRQTFHAKPGQVPMSWRHVDADGKVLGRIATQVATVLMGKHRPEYTPHCLCGDSVIVTNAAKVVLTGAKLDQKELQNYSRYPGGLRIRSYRAVMATKPEEVVRAAIIRMLPRGPLGRRMIKRLRVVAGPEAGMPANQMIPLDAPSKRLRLVAG